MQSKHKLIVCGPDKCGKTTFATHLSTAISVPLYKSKKEHNAFHQKDAQYNILVWAVYEVISMVDKLDLSIIFDRFYPCEYTYSKVFNRKTDIELIFKYDAWWNDIGGKIIYIDRKIPFEKDDIQVINTKHDEIRATYKEFLNLTKCKYLMIDNTGTPDDAVQKTIKFLEE